jgi:hypothetical protein
LGTVDMVWGIIDEYWSFGTCGVEVIEIIVVNIGRC